MEPRWLVARPKRSFGTRLPAKSPEFVARESGFRKDMGGSAALASTSGNPKTPERPEAEDRSKGSYEVYLSQDTGVQRCGRCDWEVHGCECSKKKKFSLSSREIFAFVEANRAAADGSCGSADLPTGWRIEPIRSRPGQKSYCYGRGKCGSRFTQLPDLERRRQVESAHLAKTVAWNKHARKLARQEANEAAFEAFAQRRRLITARKQDEKRQKEDNEARRRVLEGQIASEVAAALRAVVADVEEMEGREPTGLETSRRAVAKINAEWESQPAALFGKPQAAQNAIRWILMQDFDNKRMALVVEDAEQEAEQAITDGEVGAVEKEPRGVDAEGVESAGNWEKRSQAAYCDSQKDARDLGGLIGPDSVVEGLMGSRETEVDSSGVGTDGAAVSLSRAQKRRERKRKYKSERKRDGDSGIRRQKGKGKKRPSKRQKKKANSRVVKMQRKMNSKDGKLTVLRRENAELRKQQRRLGSSRSGGCGAGAGGSRGATSRRVARD